MMFSNFSSANNSRKDANSFAPSCSCAFNNAYIALLAGIAVAVSVFLSIICIDIIIALSILIIGKVLKRKKQFVG